MKISDIQHDIKNLSSIIQHTTICLDNITHPADKDIIDVSCLINHAAGLMKEALTILANLPSTPPPVATIAPKPKLYITSYLDLCSEADSKSKIKVA